MSINKSILLSELAKTTKEIESAHERLLRCERKMRGFERLKSDFIAVVSHQLRTPLSNIRWHLESAFSEKHDGLNEKQRNFLHQALMSAHKIADILDNLMKIADIEKGQIKLHKQYCDIETVFKDCFKKHRVEINKKKLIVSANILPKTFLEFDVKKISHVMHIILDNAIKYNAVGGRIFINAKIQGRGKNKNLIFSVRDTGIGIPKSQLPKLFSKFFRGRNVIKIDPEGSGLSLFIARVYIEAHGGKTWAESEGQGEGSTFYFSLPVQS